MKNEINHKTYILSILANVILISTSLDIYLPIMNSKQGTLSMFFINLFGLLFTHHYCNRGKFRHFDLKQTNQPLETLIIFFCQLLIIIQLLLVVIISIFFGIKNQ
jgi:purine-cytosine permease-like protein